MAEEKVKRICDELDVSPGEALFYLEGFEWKLDEAMEACRTKTLPPDVVRVKSAPGVPVNENSAAEESSATPLGVTPPPQILSHEASIQREQQPCRSRDELVTEFRECVRGASVKYAVGCLEASNWNLQYAVASHMDKYSPPHSGNDRSTIGRSNLGIDPSTISGQKIPPGIYPIARSNLQGSSTDDSTSTVPWYPEELSVDETSVELTPEPMYGTVPSVPLPSESEFEALLDNIAISYGSMETSFKEDGLVDVPVTASSEVEDIENFPDPTRMPPRVINSRRVLNQRLNSPEQQPPQFSDEDIKSFCDFTGTGRNQNIAINWLNRYKGNVNRAIDGYFKQNEHSSDYHSKIGHSSSMQHVEDVISKPTKESGDDQNVTVAIPPIASSQVDGKAIADEEDSSAETNTSRDRSVIGERIIVEPQAATSESSEVYDDVIITVSRLASRGATTLIPVYSD